ncbi:MAG: hypothetical protein FJW31_07025 [Acidobacteria bacterium]|nr:hypothetical protein [Acidobacteriota bacterium]
MSIVPIATPLSEHCRELLAPPPPPKPGWWSRLLGRQPAPPPEPPDVDRLVQKWHTRMSTDGRFGDPAHWRWREQATVDNEDTIADLGWRMQDALHH